MIEFNKGLEVFFDSLMPPRLRETLVENRTTYIRARMLYAMLVIATLLALVSAILLVSIHALFYREQLKDDLVIAGLTLSFAAQTWFFCRFCNYGLSAFILSNFYFVVVLSLVIASGGYDSQITILLFICPIVFFMLGDIRQGISMSVIIALIGISLCALKSIGFEFADQFRDSSPHVTLAISWVLAIISVAICIMTYDMELQKRR